MLKRFFCRIGWHSWLVGYEITDWFGDNVRAACKWCGYHGMIDSQGNLF